MFRAIENFIAINFIPPPALASDVVDPLRNNNTILIEGVALAFGHVEKARLVAVLVIVASTVLEVNASLAFSNKRALIRNRSGFNAFRFDPPPSLAGNVVDPLRNNVTIRIERIAFAFGHVEEAAIVAVLVIVTSTVYESNATLFGPCRSVFLSSCERCKHRNSHR